MITNTLEEIKELSIDRFEFWKNSYGWATPEIAKILSDARLDWLTDLTESLDLWNHEDLTDGELILAYANLGSLVEGWMKLFLCIWLDSYKKSPMKDGCGNIMRPEDLNYENLRQLMTRDILMDSSDASLRDFMRDIQNKRNAIHAFKDKDIGDENDFIKNINLFWDFISWLDDRMPMPD